MAPDPHPATAFFRDEGLSPPALPTSLAEVLHERAPGIYATSELTVPPYTLEAYVSALLRATHPNDYAVLAIDGHGAQSWAFHYYLVSGPLALFVQLPWGGAYSDAAAARAEIERVLAWAQPLPQRLAQLKQQGRLAPEQKLLVVLTRFSQPRWAWVHLPEEAEIAWQSPAQMLSRIDAELTTLNEKQAL